jgi:FKBP-type peptidyl-prolyl cis-trans isomerase FklB
MNAGAKYRFYIPQELAYGQNSPTALIPPYSVLIFEVQLLEIEK